MNEQDQLERDVEAALARLATNAVPDTERPPAPPWQERRTSVDTRRFGRATPWLIAAVLLVIAGLGLGAAVSFDASAPDRRGPVATDRPSPTGTATAPDGTLGTPVPPPTSTPSFDRSSNGADPGDGLGEFVAGIGTYGPVSAGMTRSEAQAALGLAAGDTVAGYGSTCTVAVPMPGTGDPGRPPRAIVDDSAGGTVVGFETASDAVDAFGNGVGTTLAQLEASYPTGRAAQTQSGWTFAVTDASGNGLGFQLDTVADFSAPPAETDQVVYLRPGNAAYARGAELCVG